MGKSNRGKYLHRLPNSGRGTCPVCHSTGIKLLYTQHTSDGTELKVCKKCTKATQERIDQAITK